MDLCCSWPWVTNDEFNDISLITINGKKHANTQDMWKVSLCVKYCDNPILHETRQIWDVQVNYHVSFHRIRFEVQANEKQTVWSLRTWIAWHRRITAILLSFVALDVVRRLGYLTIPRRVFHEPVSTSTVVHKHHHRQREPEAEDYKGNDEVNTPTSNQNVMEYTTHLFRGAFESETLSPLLFSLLPGLCFVWIRWPVMNYPSGEPDYFLSISVTPPNATHGNAI